MTVKVHPAESDKSSAVSGRPSAHSGVAADSESLQRDDDDEDYVYGTFCWGLCCFKGCVLGTFGALYFLLIIPIGIVLVLMGTRNGKSVHTCVGAALLSLAVVVPPLSYLIYTRCKRKYTEKSHVYEGEQAGYRLDYAEPITKF